MDFGSLQIYLFILQWNTAYSIKTSLISPLQEHRKLQYSRRIPVGLILGRWGRGNGIIGWWWKGNDSFCVILCYSVLFCVILCYSVYSVYSVLFCVILCYSVFQVFSTFNNSFNSFTIPSISAIPFLAAASSKVPHTGSPHWMHTIPFFIRKPTASGCFPTRSSMYMSLLIVITFKRN